MMPMEGRTLMPNHFDPDPSRYEMPYVAPTQRDPAVTAPAATYMTAVVNSLWLQAEGAAADGAAVSADAHALGRKWPLSALAPRTT